MSKISVLSALTLVAKLAFTPVCSAQDTIAPQIPLDNSTTLGETLSRANLRSTLDNYGYGMMHIPNADLVSHINKDY